MTSLQSLPELSASGDALVNTMIEDNTLTNVVEVIETVIDSLDHDNTAMVNHSESGTIWKFRYGSVEVFVQLTGQTEEDMLTVWATVLKLPVKNEPQLMRKLLEMNWATTMEARFSIVNDAVVAVSSRVLAGIVPGEISRAITIVATLADDNDEALQAQFG